MIDRLVLNEFKDAYRAFQRRLPKPLAFLVYGFLVWLQNKYIDAKIKAELDLAEEQYFQQAAPLPPPPQGVYSEEGSGFFDEMRITTKYYDSSDDS